MVSAPEPADAVGVLAPGQAQAGMRPATRCDRKSRSVIGEVAVQHGADRHVEKGEPLPTLRGAVLELAGASG
jgi:hypothetical protein